MAPKSPTHRGTVQSLVREYMAFNPGASFNDLVEHVESHGYNVVSHEIFRDMLVKDMNISFGGNNGVK